ncbi:MAG: hypothetical protein ABI560_08745 [Myxococcales bacterium]
MNVRKSGTRSRQGGRIGRGLLDEFDGVSRVGTGGPDGGRVLESGVSVVVIAQPV